MTSLRECDHGYHHPWLYNANYPHSCDGCYCNEQRNLRREAAGEVSANMDRVTKTPVSNFRIPLDIKQAAKEKAEREGKDLTRVVVDLLREYARED
jgi:hypothetical protein